MDVWIVTMNNQNQDLLSRMMAAFQGRFRLTAINIPMIERRGVRGCSGLDVSEQRLQTVRRVYIGEARAMRSQLAKERIGIPFDALANHGDAKS